MNQILKQSFLVHYMEYHSLLTQTWFVSCKWLFRKLSPITLVRFWSIFFTYYFLPIWIQNQKSVSFFSILLHTIAKIFQAVSNVALQWHYTESYYGNLDGGIKFQVHPRGIPPEIEKYGLSIGGGVQAAIEIKKIYCKSEWKITKI